MQRLPIGDHALSDCIGHGIGRAQEVMVSVVLDARLDHAM